MPKNRTREQYHEDLTTFAREAFEKHQISERISDRHWLVQRPREDDPTKYGWNYAAEIVVTRSGNIVVTGDIGPMIFGRYSNPRTNPEGAIHWMGRQGGVDTYVCEKAAIGMGSSKGATEKLEADIARADIKDYLNERIEEIREETRERVADEIDEELADLENVDPELQTKMIERKLKHEAEIAIDNDDIASAYRNALNNLQWGVESTIHTLHDDYPDGWEIFGSIGVVPDPTVYYAWAALERLSKLLSEKDAEPAKE